MLFDFSLEKYYEKDFEASISGFKAFVKKYPNSLLAGEATFWQGESYMGLNKYEWAIVTFQKVIKKFPKGKKVPNALLKQALAFYELKDKSVLNCF